MIYPIFVIERFYLPRTPSLSELFDELRAKFEYINPVYVRLKQMGKWTSHIPRSINTWDNITHPIYGECLALPRGATNKIRKVFARYDGVEPVFIDQRLSLPPINVDDPSESTYINNVVLRDDQELVLQAMLKYENCLIRSPTGSGKCLAPYIKVIKYNGDIVEARDIRENDLLLGPDKKPRKVTHIVNGYSRLYEITPKQKNKFKPFVCNINHILTLKDYTRKIKDIPLSEYMVQSNSYRDGHKLISTAHNDGMGFHIRCIGPGEYIGWSLDGDGRFLLEDETITHNTEVALKVIEHLLRIAGPVMVIVWESGLFDQWVERTSKRFNIPQHKIGKITGRNRNIKRDLNSSVHPITIAMQQSLVARTPRFADKIGGIICDEVQRFAAKTFRDIIANFPARYRIGISADERRSDQMEFLTYDLFGEVAEEIDKAKLIREGKIHDVLIRLIPSEFDYEIQVGEEVFKYPDAPEQFKDFVQLLNAIVEDEYRNNLIWQFLEPVLKAGHTCLVMTARVNHAMYWNARIEAAGYKSGLMIGESNKDKIEDYNYRAVLNGLLTGDIQVGVGTLGKIGAAIDIPRCNRLFILTPVNNQQKFEQAVGRIRRTCEGKSDAVCYYMWDKHVYPKMKSKVRSWYKLVQLWYKIEWMSVS